MNVPAVVVLFLPLVLGGAFDRSCKPASTLHARVGEDVGEPLMLSAYLQRGDVSTAVNASKVTLPDFPFPSFSGFFTTDPSVQNNMFWWYFPAQSGRSDVPMLIWLQGGPGGSSLFGLFSEMGPISVDENMKLHLRNTTWNRNYSMLFIDNPVGAGFSYTGTGKGYCTNEEQVAANLYSLLSQFYVMFPTQAKNPLYVMGESYAGHYVPAFGYKIHMENMMKSAGEQKVPLVGISVGDGWVDPINMVPVYPDLFYNTGLADLAQRDVVQSYVKNITSALSAGDYLKGFNIWDKMLNGDIYPYPNYFHNITGLNDYDNYLRTNAPASFGFFYPFVNSASVRKAIHVGKLPFNDGHQCELHLLKDFMVSLVDEFVVLLENYKVLIYSGQLDVIIGAPLTENFLMKTNWTLLPQYKRTDRIVWKTHSNPMDVAGYVRQVRNSRSSTTQVIVRDAGHILPHDQPERALDMVTRFIQDEPFTS